MIKPTSRMVPLPGGLRYHLLEWDAPSDHTIILVHGFLDLSWGWEPVIEAAGAGELIGRFHIVAPDMRGHGDSDRVGPGGYYHFLDYVLDLDQLITAVGRERVSLVGHSMGGMICSYYAGTAPARISRLALLEGLGPPEQAMAPPDRVAAWLDGMRRVRTRPERGMDSLEQAAERLRRHDSLLTPELAHRLAAHGTRQGEDGCFRFKHDPMHLTIGPYPFRVDVAQAFWQRITCPVLYVEGGESTFRGAPSDLEQRVRSLVNVERVVLAGAGHMMQRHQPAALASLLGRFFAAE